jgi:hypothetical protein
MENLETKPIETVKYKLKEVRKEIADKLHHVLADHKTTLGAEKLGKHIKKLSKSLAEEIVKAVKTANKKVESKKAKVKKVKVKKEKVKKKEAKKK